MIVTDNISAGSLECAQCKAVASERHEKLESRHVNALAAWGFSQSSRT
jgi:uncharacterized C2H2 Zn-finger protein